MVSGKENRNQLKKIIEKLIFKPMQRLALKKTVVFESHPDFTDNSKVLFEKMLEKGINKEYKIYWLVEEKEKFAQQEIENVEYISMKRENIWQSIISEIRNAWLLSRTSYYFFSHRNFARSESRPGQVYFNLTHGMSLKDVTGIYDAWREDYILATSDFTARLRTKEYNTSLEKFKILGFPRNDLLFKEGNYLEKLGIHLEEQEKFIIWLPTFRRQKETGRNDTQTKIASDLPIIKNKKDFERLNDSLKEKNCQLVIKPHPAQDLTYFEELDTYSQIRMIKNEDLMAHGVELYELLGQSDALISDYSSVYVDYLNLDRPIAFTVDDIEAYGENRGFLVDDPMDYMPGCKIKDLEDFLRFIAELSAGIDDYKEERKRIGQEFNKHQDDQSSERMIDFLELKNKEK